MIERKKDIRYIVRKKCKEERESVCVCEINRVQERNEIDIF